MSAPGDEAQAIEKVVDRLVERFPSASRDHIVLVVDEEIRRLDGGRVRDFIPVLAEHAARGRLRADCAPVSVAVDGVAAGSVVEDEPPELDPMGVERRERESHGGFLFGDLGGGPS